MGVGGDLEGVKKYMLGVMKKILLTVGVIVCSLFIPFKNAFAYQGGLLEGKLPVSGGLLDAAKVTDNNLTTYGKLGFSNSTTYDLGRDYTITGVYVNLSGVGNQYSFILLDANNVVLKTYKIYNTGDGVSSISANTKFYLKSPVHNVRKVRIATGSAAQYQTSIYEFDVYDGVVPDTNPPHEVANLNSSAMDTTIDLSFTNPTDVDFAGTKIYLNDVLKATLDKTKTSYSLKGLTPNTTYTIKVTTFDTTGNESDGVTITVKTKIPIVDVDDLQADAKYDRVKLSWTPPNSEFFSHVKIYRKKVEQQSFWDQLFGTTAVSAETTSDGYTPMFETNGTYWTDLTVKPETTYSYKVTSVNIEGNESQGVTIETTTPSEPVPVLTGVATAQNENGDYVVTWTSPSKGTVKLLIEGREYAQVDAATKQIIVRKEDMKTDFFGAYAATLIPIGEYGTKGQAVTVPSLGEKIDFPLSFQDFMETVVSILAWVAPFIVLSLVFIFWRPIFNFIKKAISERRVKQ